VTDDRPVNFLSDADWAAAQRMVPIVCVDAVPMRRVGRRLEVGLIQRHNPFGSDPVWCHIGGRVMRDELVTSALRRHLDDALDTLEFDVAGDLQPAYVMQWLPGGPTSQAPWAGTDPRRHAISLCYPIHVVTAPRCRTGGEALAFGWFAPGALPAVWPGIEHVVEAVVARAFA